MRVEFCTGYLCIKDKLLLLEIRVADPHRFIIRGPDPAFTKSLDTDSERGMPHLKGNTVGCVKFSRYFFLKNNDFKQLQILTPLETVRT